MFLLAVLLLLSTSAAYAENATDLLSDVSQNPTQATPNEVTTLPPAYEPTTTENPAATSIPPTSSSIQTTETPTTHADSTTPTSLAETTTNPPQTTTSTPQQTTTQETPSTTQDTTTTTSSTIPATSTIPPQTAPETSPTTYETTSTPQTTASTTQDTTTSTTQTETTSSTSSTQQTTQTTSPQTTTTQEQTETNTSTTSTPSTLEPLEETTTSSTQETNPTENITTSTSTQTPDANTSTTTTQQTSTTITEEPTAPTSTIPPLENYTTSSTQETTPTTTLPQNESNTTSTSTTSSSLPETNASSTSTPSTYNPDLNYSTSTHSSTTDSQTPSSIETSSSTPASTATTSQETLETTTSTTSSQPREDTGRGPSLIIGKNTYKTGEIVEIKISSKNHLFNLTVDGPAGTQSILENYSEGAYYFYQTLQTGEYLVNADFTNGNESLRLTAGFQVIDRNPPAFEVLDREISLDEPANTSLRFISRKQQDVYALIPSDIRFNSLRCGESDLASEIHLLTPESLIDLLYEALPLLILPLGVLMVLRHRFLAGLFTVAREVEGPRDAASMLRRYEEERTSRRSLSALRQSRIYEFTCGPSRNISAELLEFDRRARAMDGRAGSRKRKAAFLSVIAFLAAFSLLSISASQIQQSGLEQVHINGNTMYLIPPGTELNPTLPLQGIYVKNLSCDDTCTLQIEATSPGTYELEIGTKDHHEKAVIRLWETTTSTTEETTTTTTTLAPETCDIENISLATERTEYLLGEEVLMRINCSEAPFDLWISEPEGTILAFQNYSSSAEYVYLPLQEGSYLAQARFYSGNCTKTLERGFSALVSIDSNATNQTQPKTFTVNLSETLQGEVIVGEPVFWKQNYTIHNPSPDAIEEYVCLPLPEDAQALTLLTSRGETLNETCAPFLLEANETLYVEASFKTQPIEIWIEEDAIDLLSMIPADAVEITVYNETGIVEYAANASDLAEKTVPVTAVTQEITITHNSTLHYHNISVPLAVSGDAVEVYDETNRRMAERRGGEDGIELFIDRLSNRTFRVGPPVEQTQGPAEIGEKLNWTLRIGNLTVEYKTCAPEKTEELLGADKWTKRVRITSNASVHYYNVSAYADIEENPDASYRIFWLQNGSRIEITGNESAKVSFTDSDGNGTYDRIHWIVPQLSEQEYEIEADIAIINIQSYPTVGGNWTVEFNTTGTANLTIRAVEGTTWTNESDDGAVYDLRLLRILCGESEREYVWADGAAFIEDYYCNSTGYESSKVLSFGAHTLEFTFGDETAYAHNFACDSGTLDTTCYVSTTQDVTNSNISGTGNLVIQSGGNLYTNASTGTTCRIAMTGYIQVESGGSLTGNFNITAENLTVDAGGTITASSKGYPGGYGASSGSGTGGGGYATDSTSFCDYKGGAGAGYGGSGAWGSGSSRGASYGSAVHPTDLGSGGGGAYDQECNAVYAAGGSGGGMIFINVSGLMTVNGSIYADGGAGGGSDPAGGGGSGGSVYLSSSGFYGAGLIRANGGGGSGYGGAGGGGRIAIYYSDLDFNGELHADGGSGYSYGGMQGTVYVIPLTSGETHVHIDPVNTSGTYGVERLGYINATLTDYSVTIPSGRNIYGNTNISTRNLTIAVGSSINSDYKGFYPGCSSGGGGGIGGGSTGYDSSSSYCESLGAGGGGYGGSGGSGTWGARGGAYGNATYPTDLGSGGGGAYDYECASTCGGSGGGTIFLNVSEVFVLNGTLTANGYVGGNADADGGGGSGGSIFIDASNLLGSGYLNASGATAYDFGGAGGGGRIAVHYSNISFNGEFHVDGGSGYSYDGMQGTVYILPKESNETFVSIDPVNTTGTYGVERLGYVNASLTDHSVTVSTGRSIYGNANISTRNLTLEASSSINADYKGFYPGCSTGTGGGSGGGAGTNEGTSSCDSVGGGGGGYGGAGASGTYGARGGAYGTATYPTDLGSGGGGAYDYECASTCGGSGGGKIFLNVSEVFVLNGTLTANGYVGGNANADGGGGSGGSILINVSTLVGGGYLNASGATAYDYGGAGGGGRIAVHYSNISFNGEFHVDGGSGYSYDGMQGTIYVIPKVENKTRVQIEPINTTHTVGHSPYGYMNASLTDYSVTVPVNRHIYGNTNITSGNITLELNSSINADYKGYYPGCGGGTGVGSGGGVGGSEATSYCDAVGAGGAGHGGTGGSGTYGAGGSVYGNFTQPIDFGSGGGGAYDQECASNCGGSGGGRVFLNATDTLTINGTISTNAVNGSGTDAGGGGGSGGSVWMETNRFYGNGFVRANGGCGFGYGGGGAGGRIALYYTTYSSGATITANNCTGYNPGNLGTVSFNAQESGICNTSLSTLPEICYVTSSHVIKDDKNYSFGTIIFTTDGKLAIDSGKVIRFSVDYASIAGNISSSGQLLLYLNATQDLNVSGNVSGTTSSNITLWGNVTNITGKIALGPSSNLSLRSNNLNLSGIIDAAYLSSMNVTANYSTISGAVNGEYLSNLSIKSVQINLTGNISAGSINITADGFTASSSSNISSNYKGYAGGYGAASGSGTGGGGYATDSTSFCDYKGGGGGGYGGSGAWGAGSSRGASYGDSEHPTDLGSGGGGAYDQECNAVYAAGGRGAGAIFINVSGSLIVNGSLSSDGAAGGGSDPAGGGGSGGSVYVSAGGFYGAGLIRANGGGGSGYGGAGGGGRIALYYYDIDFNGEFHADGGSGYSYGGTQGTVYIIPLTSGETHVNIDPVNTSGTYGVERLGYINATLTDYSVTLPSGRNIYGNTNISTRNLTIDVGSSINSDYKGFYPGCSSGGGGGIGGGATGYDSSYANCNSVGAGGGGYGGSGGSGTWGGRGLAFGNATYPTDLGSGGGGSYDYGCGSLSACGGSGGGKVFLNVSEVFLMNGTITANGYVGGNGDSDGGGGSGGSIFIDASNFVGNGFLNASGGTAYDYGGAGGGGRIAVHYSNISFNGEFHVDGGSGYSYDGMQGTVYIIPLTSGETHVNIDPVNTTGTYGVERLGYINATLTDNSVTISTGKHIYGNTNISTSNLTIETNATINANYKGFYPGCSSGGGGGSGGGATGYDSSYANCNSVGAGGGGYGGSGGSGTWGGGGASYGTITYPTDLGSGGGGSYDYGCGSLSACGGSGGGKVFLNVSDTLVVNGTITVGGYDGGNGDSDGGGGSGGSVLVFTGNFDGSGNLSSSGGRAYDYGGGGAGGRIAVHYCTNSYEGSWSAGGGVGYNSGSAGTLNTSIRSVSECDCVAPVLNFSAPTQNNTAVITTNWTQANITITETNLDTFKFNWEGSNYSFYDSSLVLALNFNNNSAAGDNQTTAADVSRYGNDATIRGSALKFDGSNDYVSVSNSPSVNITGNISVEAWVKLNSYGVDRIRPIVSKLNSAFTSADSYTMFFGWGNDLYFVIGNGSAWNQRDVACSVGVLDRWIHLVGTWNGTTASLYKDGALCNSVSLLGAPGWNNTPLYIGSTNYSNEYFNGSIDEVRIYNRSLSSTEISEHFNGVYSNESGLVLYVPLSNRSGSTATDYSGLGNHGTLYNFASTAAGAGDTSNSGWTTYGRPTWTNRSKYGYGMGFNGLDDYLDVGNSSVLNVYGNLTVESWVKPQGFYSGTCQGNSIISKFNDSENGYFCLAYRDDNNCSSANYNLEHFYFQMKFSDGTFNITDGTSTIDLGQWYHVAGTYDGINLSIYVNGVLESSLNISKSVASNTKNLLIGRMMYNPGSSQYAYFTNATIDEVRIYNRSLNASEILMNYQSEFQKYNSAEYRFYCNVTNLSDGTYTYYGWANDTAGNQNSTEILTVSVETGDPCYVSSLVVLSSNLACTSNLTVSETGILVAGNYNVSVGEDLNLSGNMSLGSGVLNVSGDVLMRGVLNASSANIYVGGDWDSNPATFNFGTSTVRLTGTGSLNAECNYVDRFYNLYFAYPAKTTTLTGSGCVYVENYMYLMNGTLDMATRNIWSYGYSMAEKSYLFGNGTVSSTSGGMYIRVGVPESYWNNSVNIPFLIFSHQNCGYGYVENVILRSDLNANNFVIDATACNSVVKTNNSRINAGNFTMNAANRSQILVTSVLNATKAVISSNATLNASNGTVNISANFTVQANASFLGGSANHTFGNLTILSGGNFSASTGITNISDDFNKSGDFIHNSGTLHVGGTTYVSAGTLVTSPVTYTRYMYVATGASLNLSAGTQLNFRNLSAGLGFVASSNGTLNSIGSSSSKSVINGTNGWNFDTNLSILANYSIFDSFVWYVANEDAANWGPTLAIDNCVFQNATSTYAVYVNTDYVTSFNNNVIHTTSSNTYGLHFDTDGAYTVIRNLTIDGPNARYSDYNEHHELINSSFDNVRTGLEGGTASVVSKNHNNIAGNYLIWPSNWSISKSQIANDFVAGDNVSIMRDTDGDSGRFTINEAAQLSGLNVTNGSVVNITSESVVTFSGNLTVSGNLNILNGTIVNATLNGTRLSLKAVNVSISNATGIPSDGTGLKNISRYVNLTSLGGSASADLNFSYSDSGLGVDENRLRIFRYNGTSWSLVDSNVDTTKNVVYATGITSFSIFAPMEDASLPKLKFTFPTEDNNTFINLNSTQVNISITESNPDNFSFNWNGSNYSIYDDSLVLALNFNNNTAIGDSATKAVDVSKYGRNGTINGATWTLSGRFGGALQFDGMNDYVDVGSDPSLSMGLGDQTVSLWASFEDNSNKTIQTLLACGAGGSGLGQDGYWIGRHKTTGDVYVTFTDGTTDRLTDYIVLNDTISDYLLHHIVVVFDRTSYARVYIDAKEQDEKLDISSQQGDVQNSRALYVGAWSVSDSQHNGTIDEVRIYNRSLSAEEVLMHYQSEFQKYNSTEYRFYVNVTNLTDGVYTYYGWANDTSGNSNSTEIRTLTVDLIKPAIAFTYPTPASGSVNSTNSVYVNVSVNDSHNVSAFIDWNRSLVGWWSFQNTSGVTAYDLSSYSSNALMYNMNSWGNSTSGPTYSGQYGKAMRFDGVDDYMGATLSGTVNITTFEFWFYTPSIIDKDTTPGKVLYTDSNSSLICFGNCTAVLTNEIITFLQSSPYPRAAWTGTNSISVGWHHLALVWNSSAVQYDIYLDGELKPVTKSGTPWRVSATYIQLGGVSGYTYFNGTLDEVLLWSRALSAEEINASFSASSWRLYHNFTGLSSENYTYTAYAIDQAGNVNSTEERIISLNTNLPSGAGVVLNDSDGDTIQLSVLDTQVWCNASVSDGDGWQDIVSANATLYHMSSSYGAENDKNVHYGNSSCELIAGTGIYRNVSCGFSLEHEALNGSWNCTVSVRDTANSTTLLTGNNTVDELVAISILESEISFGTLAPGANTTTNQTVNVTNLGNLLIDVQVNGSAMGCSGYGSIPVNNTRYALSSATYDEMSLELSTTPTAITTYDLGIEGAATPEDTNSTKLVYWTLITPQAVEGVCRSNVTVTAIAG